VPKSNVRRPELLIYFLLANKKYIFVLISFKKLRRRFLFFLFIYSVRCCRPERYKSHFLLLGRQRRRRVTKRILPISPAAIFFFLFLVFGTPFSRVRHASNETQKFNFNEANCAVVMATTKMN
jgi:hypothetical protein